jgi:rhodanese-related sulfurtransferase/biotin operon repressor
MDKHRSFKDDLFTQMARISHALASPRRLELVDLLAQAERSVEDLASLTGMSIANTSQHLQQLRRAHLVSVRRQGQYSLYRLRGPEVFRIWQAIRNFGETELAEVDRLVHAFLTDRHDLEPIIASELLERIRNDEVTVLDVRPAAEYQAGHITGARSVPVSELEKRLKAISKRREVVAYCRGPFCVYADEAVNFLKQRGFRARRLDIGFPDWQAAGLPVSLIEPELQGRKGK